MQKLFLAFVLSVIAATGGYVLLHNTKAEAPSNPRVIESSQTNNQNSASTTKSDEESAVTYDIDSPDSTTVIVNKLRPLPEDFKADDLFVPDAPLRQSASSENMHVRKVLETDLLALFAAASDAGIRIQIGSAYRSAATQNSLYNGYVASSGQAFADLTSARPSFSEHQTGLSIDFSSEDGQCFLEKCFADTIEGKWLAANAPNYGFVLRYPLNKTAITGYDFEPWHFRYLGKQIASQITDSGVTVEEFFGTGPAPDYR